MSDENKELVEKINAAFSEGSTEGFLSFCNDDVKWTIVGDKTVEGKEAIREFMAQMEGMEPPQFTVDAIVADDKAAVAHGDMSMKDKDGTLVPYRYCDFYQIENGKVSDLTTYVIKTNKGE